MLSLVVLSSGQASRLRPWSDTGTKALLPTCEGSLLARLAQQFPVVADDVHVLCRVPPRGSEAHLRELVRDAVPGARVGLVDQGGEDAWVSVYGLVRELGNEGSVVLVNGDLILDNRWVDTCTHAERAGGVTLCASDTRGRGYPFHVAEGPGVSGRFAYSPRRTSRTVGAIGLSVLARGALSDFDPARAVGENPWFRAVLPFLETRERVLASVRAWEWEDVGSWPDLYRWELRRHAGVPGRSCCAGRVGERTRLHRSVVMVGASVGSGCHLDEVMVLPGGRVQDGEELRRCGHPGRSRDLRAGGLSSPSLQQGACA